MITVVTPTIRAKGLELVRKSLENQTFKNFEWLIGSSFDPQIDECEWVVDDFKEGFWSLNRIYNKLIKKARGELIVSWQDFIWAPPDALQKFWSAYMETGGVISGVGDQYSDLNKWGKPINKIWLDPRKNSTDNFVEVDFCDIEWNFCACPKQALTEIGGFYEELDFKGFGMDGYQVNERLNGIGYKFYLDRTNESFTLRHTREDYGGEQNWEKNNNISNGEYYKVRDELIKKGHWPRIPLKL